MMGGVGCGGGEVGEGGVVTPRPFAPPHDHAQPQASIPKRYTTVASLSSPVIGLGPCWVKVCGRNHSSIPTQPCTRARASAPPRAPIVAFIRTFWPHHSAPQSRHPGFQSGTKTRQVAPQCAIAQGPPGQAKICNANRLKAKRSPRNALPSRATATPGIRTIQLVHLRGYNALVVVRLLSRTTTPTPACRAASCNLRAFIRALGINTNRRRYTDCSAPQPHGPHHPQRPPPGLAALARPPFRRVGLEFSWRVPGIQLESNWNLTSFQMNARSQRRLGGYGGGEGGGRVRRDVV